MMIYPKLIFKHLKTRRSIAHYPLYDVPNKQAEETLGEPQVQENFGYFMKFRLDRLSFFQEWLRSSFGVNAPLNGDGLLALNDWLNEYGGGLIGHERNRAAIFATYQPTWLGEYAGYNVMLDIGVFVGEYLIAKRLKLDWEIYRGHADQDGALIGPNLKRPHIGVFPRGWGKDALGLGYGLIANARKMSHIGYRRSVSDRNALIDHCKQSLQLANAPSDDRPYIFGDYSNEPI